MTIQNINKTTSYINKYHSDNWFIFDADSKSLGRLSSEIAMVLLGKRNVSYTPNQKSQQGVIIINAEKIAVSGKKENYKCYYKHSGTPGGLKMETLKLLRKRKPVKIIEQSVKGMLPKGSLGRRIFAKLKVYKGAIHPHEAQIPKLIELN
nr:ribosomal protein L13 [Cryptomonas borealis]